MTKTKTKNVVSDRMVRLLQSMIAENDMVIAKAKDAGFVITRVPSSSDDSDWSHRVVYGGKTLVDYDDDLSDFEIVALMEWLEPEPQSKWPLVARDYVRFAQKQREELRIEYGD